MRTLTAILACSLLAPAAAAAQGSAAAGPAMAAALSPTAYLAHIRFLSDDDLEGRAPGTRGGELAARYIAAQFERLGLTPAGDSGTWYHRVPVITLDPAPTISYAAGGPATIPSAWQDRVGEPACCRSEPRS